MCPSNLTNIKIDPRATDSFQNLLFPLLLYTSLFSRPPHNLTLISHAFKHRRFLTLHLPAIRFPVEKVTYVGIDPPEHISPKEELEAGEEKRGYGIWKGDLYGVREVLREKREKRGWSKAEEEKVLSGVSEEGPRGLLVWKGGLEGVEKYQGELPWDRYDMEQ